MRRLTLAGCLVALVFVSGGQAFAGRYYGPTMGRWLTPDPALQKMHPNDLLKLHGGKMLATSPYAYAFGNPLKYTDPDGNIPVPVINAKEIGAKMKSNDQKESENLILNDK